MRYPWLNVIDFLLIDNCDWKITVPRSCDDDEGYFVNCHCMTDAFTMIASCCPDAKVFDNTEVMYSFISNSFSEFIRLYHSRTDTNETGGYVYTLLVLDLKTLVNCFEMNLVPCACKQTDTTLNNKTSRGGRIENCRLFTRDPVMGRRNILGTSSHLGPSFSVVTTPTTNLKF